MKVSSWQYSIGNNLQDGFYSCFALAPFSGYKAIVTAIELDLIFFSVNESPCDQVLLFFFSTANSLHYPVIGRDNPVTAGGCMSNYTGPVDTFHSRCGKLHV